MSPVKEERIEVPEHLRVRPLAVTPSSVVAWIKPEAPSALERRCMELLKPGDYEIFDEKIANFLDEAREIFIRSGVTSMLRSGDLIVGLYTATATSPTPRRARISTASPPRCP